MKINFKGIPAKVYFYSVTIVIILSITYFIVHGMISDAKKLGYAEGMEKQAQNSFEASKTIEKAYNELLIQNSGLLDRIKALEDKDKRADEQRKVVQKQKIAVIRAKVTPIEVAKDVKEFLGIEPEITPIGEFVFTSAQTQDFIINSIRLSDLEKDVESLQHQLTLSQQRSDILNTNLNKVNEVLTAKNKALEDCQNATTAYKHAAKKSFGAKLWSGTKRVGEYAIVAIVTIILTHK